MEFNEATCERILERLATMEQKLVHLGDRLDEHKKIQENLSDKVEELQEINIRTKSFIGAIIFVVTGIFSLVVAFKEQVLHMFGIK